MKHIRTSYQSEAANAIRHLRRCDMARITINPALAPFLRRTGRKRARKYGLRQWQGESLALSQYLADGLKRLETVN